MVTLLPDAPRVAMVVNDQQYGSIAFYIVTFGGLMYLTPDMLIALATEPPWFNQHPSSAIWLNLYPNSAVLHKNHLIIIGMRSGIAVIDLEAPIMVGGLKY